MAADNNAATETIYTTTCSYDCGGRCLLKVHVRDGRIKKISTGKHDGMDLRACPRGLAQNAVAEEPNRLTRPLKRIGPRGTGEFEPVSWDEALATVASEIQRVRNQYGTEAIYFLANTGSLATLHNTAHATHRFFGLLGECTTTWGVTSFEGALQSSLATYGTPFTGSSRDTLPDSRLIILWGWNPVVTRFGPDTAPALSRAKKAGAEIVSVDPRRNQTAIALETRWIPIRPGTDAAMLIAMAQVMVTERLCDDAFLSAYTVGFDKFTDYLMGRTDGTVKTPAWAQDITGVPVDKITALARDYANLKPAALITGWAPGRTAAGEQFHRTAAALSAITGNVGIEGGYAAGGVNFMPLGLMSSHIPVPDTEHSQVHVTELYDAILKGKAGGYPGDCRLLYITGCNLLNQFLNLNKGRAALEKPELIVVQDLFLTPTARFADMVLPVSHFFEREDIGQPYGGGPYNLYMRKVVDGPPGTKSDLQIFTELAKHLGINNYLEKTETEWLEAIVAAEPDLPDRDELKRKGVHLIKLQRPYVAFREQMEDLQQHPFPTSSGKIEIDSRMFADLGNPDVPSIPTYLKTWEGPEDSRSRKFPLQLVSPHSRARVNSQFDNIPKIKKLADDTLWISPHDAEKREIENGDAVKVYNDRGSLVATARVTENIMPGVVSLDQGIWYRPDDSGVDTAGCVNVLTRDGKSPAGAFTCNTCLVQILKDG